LSGAPQRASKRAFSDFAGLKILWKTFFHHKNSKKVSRPVFRSDFENHSKGEDADVKLASQTKNHDFSRKPEVQMSNQKITEKKTFREIKLNRKFVENP